MFEKRYNLPPIADPFAAKFYKSISSAFFPNTLPLDLVDEINDINKYDLTLQSLAEERVSAELANASNETFEAIRVRRLFNQVFGATATGHLLGHDLTEDLNTFVNVLTNTLAQLSFASFEDDVGHIVGLIAESLVTPDYVVVSLIPQLTPDMPSGAKVLVEAALDRRNMWRKRVILSPVAAQREP